MCIVCQSIADVILEGRTDVVGEEDAYKWIKYELGSWGSINQDENCSRIKRLTRSLEKVAQIDLQPSDPFRLQRHPSDYQNRWHFVVGQSAATVSVIDVLAEHPGAERNVSVHPHQIDIHRVRSWIQECDTNHTGICYKVSDPWRTIAVPSEILLINVELQCLERCVGSTAYIALSYMWGHSKDPFVTVVANLEQLCKKDALTQSEHRHRLPRTIQDAISLTALLGQRYLWVDRFCIIQDDYEHKAAQLDAMASIYANAVLTIVAADGKDDTFGLRGIIPNGLCRDCPFDQFDFAADCRLITEVPFKKSRYYTRGWTYQEEMLSPRKLEFRAGSVTWTCCRRSRRENEAIPVTLPRDIKQDMRHDDLLTPWPNIRAFTTSALTYGTRQLSYAADAMNAFSAILSAMSRSMQGGHFFGTPELFFDGMLLWQPYRRIERRRDSDGKVLEMFPSWAWIGWTGKLDARLWTESHNFLEKEDAFRSFLTLYPTVDWYKRAVVGDHLVGIRNDYYQHNQVSEQSLKEFNDEHKTILPQGWRFRRPIPLATSPLRLVPGTWLPILEFRSERMQLKLGTRVHEFGYCVSGFLQTAEGQNVGFIRLNNEEDWPSGTACELISISRAEADCDDTLSDTEALFPELADSAYRASLWSDDDTKMFRDKVDGGEHLGGTQGRSNRVYRFYNVLWVSWSGEIAYRVALGRVIQEYWDSRCPEAIDIKLG